MDPGDRGCQSFEATSFLLYRWQFDTSVPLVLWQVATIGNRDGVSKPDPTGINVLLDRLSDRYGPDHEVVLYEASPYAICEPSIERVRVKDVDPAKVAGMATIYVPPKGDPSPDLDMFERLGLPRPRRNAIDP